MGTPSSDRAGIVQIVKALEKAGWKPTHVDYGDGEYVVVHSTEDAVDEVMAVDDAFLIVLQKKGADHGWVRFVMGNDPEEVVADYTVNLSPAIDPVTDRWWS